MVLRLFISRRRGKWMRYYVCPFVSRLKFGNLSRAKSEEKLPGLCRVQFHHGIQILKVRVMGGRDRVSCAIHANAVKSARDNRRLTSIQPKNRHLWTRHALPGGRTVHVAINNVSGGDQSVACSVPAIAQTNVIMLSVCINCRLKRWADQFLAVAAIRAADVVRSRRGAGTQVKGC